MDPKDAILSVNRCRHSHRDLAAARRLSHGLVLDLEGFDPLPMLGRAASDVDLITDMQIAVCQMDDGDTYPVEIIRYDADLLFHDIALLLQEP